jgi:hypothetical protein
MNPHLLRRMPHALLIGFAMALMDITRTYPAVREANGAASWPWFIDVGFTAAVQMVLMVMAITATENSKLAERHRMLAVALAVVAMALVSSAFRSAFSYVFTAKGWVGGMPGEWTALFFYQVWVACAVGGLAGVYFSQWEKGEQSARRLRDAELERQASERRMVESRLSVIKARVEPEFLFNSIAAVQRLYRDNVDAAERRVDDLIVYLRAALPQVRGDDSRLGDEIHLIASYLKVSEDAFAGRLGIDFAVSESAAAASFPPTALLLLVEDALHRARRMEQPALGLAASAESRGGDLVIHVDDDCPFARLDAAAQPSLAAPEEVLHAFFGEGARVSRSGAPAGGTRVTVEIRNAIAPRAHR